MKRPVRGYLSLPFEHKVMITTGVSLCFSTALALSKLIIGLFSNVEAVGIAVYTFAILLAKFNCILGIRSSERSFERRNMLISVFLFAASAAYIFFMCRLFFAGSDGVNRGIRYATMLAFVSFCELFGAIFGLFRMKDKGHFYRNIKIINFCVALIALLTTQTAILNALVGLGANTINACTGMAVGGFIALCSVYIALAPRLSVIGREHNRFTAVDESKNALVDMNSARAEIVLCRSFTYGDYVYSAAVDGGSVEGDIVRTASLWKHMPLPVKVVCCILSEILAPLWLVGRAVLFLRSTDLPGRLERIMNENGFVRVVQSNEE